MGDVTLLLSPKWRSVLNGGRGWNDRLKAYFLILLVALACLGIFFGAHHVLNYIRELYLEPGLEFMELRFEINRRLLGMVVLTFLAVLVFSNVITALTTFFLSDDLELVGALPVSGDSMFMARFAEMVVDSSWMIVVFGAPVYVAFGVVYRAGFWYYLAIPAVTLPFILMPAGLGSMVAMALVSAFPARRIRDILFLLAVFAAGLLFMLLRLMQPEQLVNPDVSMEVIDFVRTLQAPVKSWMPNFWATEVFAQLAKGGLRRSGWMYFGLLWTAGLGMTALAALFSRAVYHEAFSKAQEASRIRISKTGLVNRMVRAVSAPFVPATRQMIMKDIRVFMRDPTQWSQLFLLAALIVIYIFNVKALPLSRLGVSQFKIQNLVSYLNIAMAGFVCTALSARFVYPMVSLEGRAFWIVKSSPLSLRGFLWSKFMISAVPLVVIGEILIVVTNYILDVTVVVWYASVITMALMVMAICGLGVGLGARFPRFHAENPTKVATSFGGVVYMVVTMSVIALVILLEAAPTGIYFYHTLYRGEAITPGQWVYIIVASALAAVIMLVATIAPMKIGLKWIEKMEIG
jgi:ABC-2 type transport system permease protein